ncbi:hypothetical protein [Chiayiivirga flava]|uniref:Uncharacterized protein n=1 Tax=Chiayiivirga flava TaxID=659595 RepID=A0A7W8G0Y5_9GAMM|nr:hypothetical protein [Chiayiivirga flava]MBB5209646.1 hypothetical protein [Chiayiivirga flava]
MPRLIARIALFLAAMLVTASVFAEPSLLPNSPQLYQTQTDRIRQSVDRPWAPDAGQLGNLRFLHIRANDCAVRIVSGNENRVFPGTQRVYVVEGSRVLDNDPDETPIPRNVTLAPDPAQACAGVGSCGVSTAWADRAPRSVDPDAACFTVQLASAHYLLLSGDNLAVLVDRVRQPWLRIAVNPFARPQLWFEQVDIGLLSIAVNAGVRIGGTGRVDHIGAQSSNGSSAMYLHEFDANHVGVSTTTTGTTWSIRIREGTEASYYQPARAPGRLAEGYRIEIDGPLERLEVPASRVDPHPITEATRQAARTLREEVRKRLGPTPRFPAADTNLPTAAAAMAGLKRDARDHLVAVVSRYVPAGTRITDVTLYRNGEGRLEGLATDDAAVDAIQRALRASGEFTHIDVRARATTSKDGRPFAAQMYFPCDKPGDRSVCPAGDPRRNGNYSELQVIEYLEALLGPDVTLHDAVLDGGTIRMEAYSSSATAAQAALDRIGADKGFFRTSITGIGPDKFRPITNLNAKLELVCSRPPRVDGVCTAAPSGVWLSDDALRDGPE